MKKTIIDLFESSVEKYGKKTFLLEKRHHAFQPTTYAETKEQALEVGAGLASLGIRPKDKVAILAEGSNGWIISELGIFYAGAISVPLSVKLEEANDLLFRLRHAEVKALFVSKQQLPKIRRIRAEFPDAAQRKAVLCAQGGTSWAAVLGCLVLLMVIGSAFTLLLGPNVDALLNLVYG